MTRIYWFFTCAIFISAYHCCIYLDDMMLFDIVLDDHSLVCWGFMFLGDYFSANKGVILIEIDVKWSLEIDFVHRNLSRFIYDVSYHINSRNWFEFFALHGLLENAIVRLFDSAIFFKPNNFVSQYNWNITSSINRSDGLIWLGQDEIY